MAHMLNRVRRLYVHFPRQHQRTRTFSKFLAPSTSFVTFEQEESDPNRVCLNILTAQDKRKRCSASPIKHPQGQNQSLGDYRQAPQMLVRASEEDPSGVHIGERRPGPFWIRVRRRRGERKGSMQESRYLSHKHASVCTVANIS